MTFVYVFLIVLSVWIAILSFLLLRALKHYKNLTSSTHQEGLDKILDALLAQGAKNAQGLDSLKEAVHVLDTDRHSYLQRFGYVKFNPFEDRVGGEQSFVIALLDNKKNGLVKTFMYTRDGVRVYVKPIKNGISEDYELSKEEQDAISQAS